jgi:hypothetical protein
MPRRMRYFRSLLLLLSPLLCFTTSDAQTAKLDLRPNDVVALLGGEAAVLEGERGHLESLLTLASADKHVRFRNLAWEGDTAFEQPRDVNYPDTIEQLKRAGATVVICRFGQYESLAGPEGLPAFVAAYERLCDPIEKQLGSKRLVLIAPGPFAKPRDPLLPDHSTRNDDVKQYAQAVAALASRRGYAFAAAALDSNGPTSTENGIRPAPAQTATEAATLAGALGCDVARDLTADGAGRWSHPDLEALRQAIVVRNKLWFDYTRPMNWAFLGGDRVQVQASRDHRDQNVRWFPGEMEKFVPLIEAADKKVDEAARKAAEGARRN